MELDNADCYGTSEGLAGHIKNAFQTVSSVQWKQRNAGHYELRNIGDSSRVNNEQMVYNKVIGSWARETQF